MNCKIKFSNFYDLLFLDVSCIIISIGVIYMNFTEWAWYGYLALLGLVLLGGALGFFISQWAFKRYLKKNPPINENMIRAMFLSMGRKPSEKQVRQVMKQMQDAK
jgi:uncharacterized protein YneF (UPF0154 family)